MAVIITNPLPAASVVKKLICPNCGVELSYTPHDVKKGYHTDYTGCKDSYNTITCVNCRKVILVS